jgi:hypothetical protein
MPPLLALVAAAVASMPGLALSYWLVSGHKQSFAKALVSFQTVALYFIPFYIVGALVFGALLWLVLVKLGQLTLPAFLVGSLVPVVLVLAINMLLRGYGAGTHLALVAFGLPAVVMGFALWAFSVRWPIG